MARTDDRQFALPLATERERLLTPRAILRRFGRPRPAPRLMTAGDFVRLTRGRRP